MKKLKTILQSNNTYYLLIIFIFIYIILYINNYEIKEINDKYYYFYIRNITINDDNIKLELKGKYNMSGTYYFKDKSEISNLELNDYIKVYGSVYIPSNNTIDNTFNYNKYLKSKNIYYVININNIELINKNNNIFYRFKNYIYKRLNTINNEYLYAFIIGNSKYIDSEVYNNYKINNILHLFAISGFHISIFVSIINYLFRRSNKYVRFIFTVFILMILCFISSYSPSILRASIFYILKKINKLNISKINLLIITFLLLIYINPFYIYSFGFKMSFIVTFFILVFNSNNIFKISLISFLSSFPLVINNYFYINIIGFINNMFFIPYISILYPLSLISFIMPFALKIFNILTNIMEIVSFISTKLFNITVYFHKLNILEIIIFYLLLFIFSKYKKNIYFFILIVFLIFIKFFYINESYVYYFDVGQGDSILLHIDSNNILIDTGGSYNNKDNVTNKIIPFLLSRNINKIDVYIISHGDMDHMGESVNLIENFKVDKVIFNCGEYNDLENELIGKLEDNNIEYYSCISKLNIGNNTLEFLNTGLYDNENDNSSVVYFNYNNYKFLFMADASFEREKDILKKYNISNIDFLKVGHHGSNTSTSEEFISNINPKYSIISVGTNKYGHPKENVLKILKKNNSKIYRTDEDGSIEIKIKSDRYTIETCEP